jgi:tetratricopeptide (TPR) repeat protein
MRCRQCGVQNPREAQVCLRCDADLFSADDDDQPMKPRQQQRHHVANGVKENFDDEEQDDSQNSQFDSNRAFDNRYGSNAPRTVRRSKTQKPKTHGAPALLAMSAVAIVVLILIGGVAFYITKSPEEQRLYDEGQKQIGNGQYAFAVTTLSKASTLKSDDPKIQLALARAYIGVDQIDKAWDCISKAQKLGEGVAAQPALATELANFYRRQGKYEKAIDILRPLAKAGTPGKKAELADLLASFGDECLTQGKLELALKSWEEVKDLREGSRFSEAEARLSTIYQRLANSLASSKNDAQALAFLDKLNTIAQNPKNYEMAADIYLRSKQVDKAIESLRKAITLSSKNPELDKKLSDLLARRGKELVNSGDNEAGVAYLQQAKELNAANAVPEAALRSVSLDYDKGTKQSSINGEIINLADKSLNSLDLKAELFDNANSKSLWSKEQKIVDSFTPPMQAKESKPFTFSAPIAIANNGTNEFRLYINGSLYKSYPVGEKSDKDETTSGQESAHATNAKAIATDNAKTKASSENATAAKASTPAPAVSAPVPGLQATPQAVSNKQAPASGSAEEKTLKDLEP